MPAVHITEPQRRWLLRLAQTDHVEWLRVLMECEDPERRGVPKGPLVHASRADL